jgi:PhnB protein
MRVEPYLFFDGRCEEALDFYREKLGAEVLMLMRFKDAPPDDGPPPEGCAPPPSGSGDKVMHVSFKLGDTTLMASDGNCQGKPKFEGVSLSLTLPDDAAAERAFAALAEGGSVQMPIGPSFFATRFGMVADRFGVNWMVVTETAPG